MARLPKARNKEELVGQVLSVWDALPQETIASLIDTMPRQLSACLKAKGGHTKY